MRVKYTNDEKVDMILIFGECGKIPLHQQIYTKEDIPIDDIHPTISFRKTLRQNWPKETRNRGLTATGVENEIRVIEAVDNDARVSQRFIAR